jgi:hypothetical protein
MKTCLQASAWCVFLLGVVAASVGAIVDIAYLSIALDRESSDDPSCPEKIRDWCIGLLVWCVWCVLATCSQRKNTNDDDDGAVACGCIGACIQGLVGLATFAFAIAVPIIIDRDLRGVCPDTAYDEAFDVVFVYYVTLLGLLGVFGCASCVGFGVMAKEDATPATDFGGLSGTGGLATPL